MCVCERECVCVREREGESVCVCERERDGERECVCVREREGERVCVCERERGQEEEGKGGGGEGKEVLFSPIIKPRLTS